MSLSSNALPLAARRPQDSAGIFLGVQEFEDSAIAPVPFAVDDAVDLAHTFVLGLGLIDSRKTLLLLSGDPKKEASQRRLQELLEAKVQIGRPTGPVFLDSLHRLGATTGPEGLFVVAVASHGFTDQGKIAFAMAETRKRRTVATGLAFDVMLDDVAGARARKRVVLLDACRERLDPGTRTLADTDEELSQAMVQEMERARGCAILSGASRGGFAYDDVQRQNGVFTAALIDGLQGNAEGSPEGCITLELLAKFADTQVRDWVAANRPQHLEKSIGISESYEPPGIRKLPLATNEIQQAHHFRTRRRSAISGLARHLDVRDQLILDAERLLDVSLPTPKHLELLDEIGAFDGTPRMRRSVAMLLAELTGSSVSAMTAAKKVEPSGKPSWAAETGSDQFGKWADLLVGSAFQRMRWIEPESDEASKTKAQNGFWLAATRCTGELVFGIMPRPQRFSVSLPPGTSVGLTRDDLENFLGRLQRKLDGLEVRVPSQEQLLLAHFVESRGEAMERFLRSGVVGPNRFGVSELDSDSEWTQELLEKDLDSLSYFPQTHFFRLALD